jgi:hypothetical protein
VESFVNTIPAQKYKLVLNEAIDPKLETAGMKTSQVNFYDLRNHHVEVYHCSDAAF